MQCELMMNFCFNCRMDLEDSSDLSLMITAEKKTQLKDKAEGCWLKKEKVRSRGVAKKEESEDLRTTGF